jgi:putative oxidoreductase
MKDLSRNRFGIDYAISALRIITALLFMAHAITRLALGTIPQFAFALGQKGWPWSTLLVYLITFTEIISGVMLITNRFVTWASAALAFIAFMGIVIIHFANGWFVGEFATGGMEYSVALLMMLWVIVAWDQRQ